MRAVVVLESNTDGRNVCSCASQLLLLLRRAFGTRPTPTWMQKERRRFIQVRPRTAIERAPSLMRGCAYAMHEASYS